MHHARLLPGVALLITVSLSLALLHACHDTPRPTEVDANGAAVVTKTLTILGSGTGDGVVSSSPAGIDCKVTGGQAAATGCKAQFSQGASVRLTATPKSGHSFRGWFRLCTGTGTCTASMTVHRTVEARFLKGPFKITISGGVTGEGSGRVRSQSGLTPAINCLITNGRPAATGCAATYPANTALVLTATPAAGQSFSHWGSPCLGSTTCRYSVIQSRSIAVTFAPQQSASSALRGRWSPAFTTPVVGIHLHLLPTGKVLLWGDRGGAQLWDPANPGTFTDLGKTYRIFCSGHTFMPDGRLLVVGGTITGTLGDPRAVLFDPIAETWSATGSMARGRYYPTATVLPSGEILAVSGSDQNNAVVTVPEIGNGSTWRRLTNAVLSIPNPYYPAMFVAPNGKVFLAGFPGTTRYLNVDDSGGWTTVAQRIVADRRLGSAVMYAPGKILYAGGGDPPTNSAEVIDLNQAAPAWRSVAGMQFARRQMNATLLADGQVLVTHGSSGAGFNDITSPVYDAELWNPETESWRTLARESVVRAYHSAALLLPDGRVLSSGSGEGASVSFERSELSAQIFSPPYLYNADGSLAQRPVIASAPTRISYGTSFTVETPDAGSVTRGTLIRLSSVTHAFNQSQLIYPLTFSATGSNTLEATGPTNANLAPPGPYMLFLVNPQGVPSVARMVTVGQ
jgi:Domain of unknown function (DUF1929)/Divergent InlB B-repeat domain